MVERPPFHCSFCNKSEREVAQLVAGTKAFICDECVDLCAYIISSSRGGKAMDLAATEKRLDAEYRPNG